MFMMCDAIKKTRARRVSKIMLVVQWMMMSFTAKIQIFKRETLSQNNRVKGTLPTKM